MLYTVSYAEEMKVGWRKFDEAIWENLERTFGINQRFHIGYHVATLSGVRAHLGEAVRYVNVQPPKILNDLGLMYDWLPEYQHQQDACYIFGSNQQEIEVTAGDYVAIALAGSSLFSFCAAAIVLNDRYSRIAQ